jgi:hypothetical protein
VAVTAATVHVFDDAGGTTPTPGTSQTLVSQAFPPALDLGIVKVQVTGLSADTCVFVQTETDGVFEPAAPPFSQVCTAAATTKSNASDQVIANDLLRHEVFAPDGVTPAAGALILVSLPGVGAHPLSAFVGEGFAAPAAVVDLNNLFAGASAASADVTGGEDVEIVEFRGLLCPGLVDHKLLRLRRAPPHEEIAGIGRRLSQLEAPAPCFFADTVCDGTVNILDVQRVLNIFNAAGGSCAFNPDLDIVADETINILDVQSVLNRLGESEPFTP